jgi:hypothetical protein
MCYVLYIKKHIQAAIVSESGQNTRQQHSTRVYVAKTYQHNYNIDMFILQHELVSSAS